MSSAYSEAQVNEYLRHVSLPVEYQCTVASRPELDLGFLTAIHAAQICTFPYENLSLHYSKDRTVSLDPQRLYEKYMSTGVSQGRGGYCMEGTVFLKHILRKLGFSVYSVGARIRLRVDGVPQGDYTGWVHSVNIVTLSNGSRYMVDVSFGGDGATKPLPLDETVITKNIGTQEIRLAHDYIPPQSCINDKNQMMWIYQYRNSPDKPWNSFFAFPEMEFFEQDFEVMSFFTSKSFVGSFQTRTVLVVKFLRREAEVYGKIMLVNEQVKRNDGGKTSLVQVCETEDERITALEELFGIRLTEEERLAIQGHLTELTAKQIKN